MLHDCDIPWVSSLCAVSPHFEKLTLSKHEKEIINFTEGANHIIKSITLCNLHCFV